MRFSPHLWCATALAAGALCAALPAHAITSFKATTDASISVTTLLQPGILNYTLSGSTTDTNTTLSSTSNFISLASQVGDVSLMPTTYSASTSGNCQAVFSNLTGSSLNVAFTFNYSQLVTVTGTPGGQATANSNVIFQYTFGDAGSTTLTYPASEHIFNVGGVLTYNSGTISAPWSFTLGGNQVLTVNFSTASSGALAPVPELSSFAGYAVFLALGAVQAVRTRARRQAGQV